jgi:TPR repeat protein
MSKPWYRKLFGGAAERAAKTTPDDAEDGDAERQFGLGLKFATSTGEAHSYLQAAQWYRKAADQNHPMAQFNLGIMYGKGQGVARDPAVAMGWLLKAANQGHAGAQFNLGMNLQRASFNESPEQARESRIEAYKWYHLAAAQEYLDSAIAGGRITLSMTHETVAEANRRVAAFIAVKPPLPAAV